MSDDTKKTLVVMGPLLPVPEAPAGEPDLCTVGDLRPGDVAEAVEDLHGPATGKVYIPRGAVLRLGFADDDTALVISRDGVALRVGLTGKVRRLRVGSSTIRSSLNALAREFYRIVHGRMATEGYDFSAAPGDRQRNMYDAAEAAYEHFKGDRPDYAEDEEPDEAAPAATPAPGHRWAPCDCAELDPSDRPCPSCAAQGRGAPAQQAPAALGEALTIDSYAGYAAAQALLGEDEGHEDPQGNAVAVAQALLTPGTRIQLAAEQLAALPHGPAAALTLGRSEEAFALLVQLGARCESLPQVIDNTAMIVEWAHLLVGGVEVRAQREPRPIDAADLKRQVRP